MLVEPFHNRDGDSETPVTIIKALLETLRFLNAVHLFLQALKLNEVVKDLNFNLFFYSKMYLPILESVQM